MVRSVIMEVRRKVAIDDDTGVSATTMDDISAKTDVNSGNVSVVRGMKISELVSSSITVVASGTKVTVSSCLILEDSIKSVREVTSDMTILRLSSKMESSAEGTTGIIGDTALDINTSAELATKIEDDIVGSTIIADAMSAMTIADDIRVSPSIDDVSTMTAVNSENESVVKGKNISERVSSAISSTAVVTGGINVTVSSWLILVGSRMSAGDTPLDMKILIPLSEMEISDIMVGTTGIITDIALDSKTSIELVKVVTIADDIGMSTVIADEMATMIDVNS